MSSHAAPDAPARRASDRWITPGVVCVLVLAGMVLVLAVIASVTYLQARGEDPEPMLKLVGLAVTAAGSAGGFLLQLLNRSSTTKTERSAGTAAAAATTAAQAAQDAHGATLDTLDAVQAHLDQLGPATRYRPPVLPPVPERGTAPAGNGS